MSTTQLPAALAIPHSRAVWLLVPHYVPGLDVTVDEVVLAEVLQALG